MLADGLFKEKDTSSSPLDKTPITIFSGRIHYVFWRIIAVTHKTEVTKLRPGQVLHIYRGTSSTVIGKATVSMLHFTRADAQITEGEGVVKAGDSASLLVGGK